MTVLVPTDIETRGESLLRIADGWDGPGSKAPDRWTVLLVVLLLRKLIAARQLLGVLPPRHGCQSFWPFDRPVGVEIAELEQLEVVHGLRPYAPKENP